jgi:hypothetical protein
MSEIDDYEDYMLEEYNEKLVGYDTIRKEINDRYDCKLTNKGVRKEFLASINKVFANMSDSFGDRLFDVIYVMMEEFKISENKLVRYLDRDNMSKLRNFAVNHYETGYWETKEKEKKDNKLERHGKGFRIRTNISELFE